jgi:hypothetical protein
MMLLGHYSISPRVNVYGGAGYIPFAARKSEFSYVGARTLVGMQWAIGQARERFTTLNLEADTQWIHFDQPYRASAVTAGFAVHF